MKLLSSFMWARMWVRQGRRAQRNFGGKRPIEEPVSSVKKQVAMKSIV